MPFNDLTNKLEEAANAVLTAAPISGLTGYTGQSSATRAHPSVVFMAQSGEEFPQGSGNYRMALAARVESSGDVSTLAAHRGYFAGIVDLFTDSAIAATLSAALADFHAIGANNPKFSESIEDRAYVSELSLDVYCCAVELV